MNFLAPLFLLGALAIAGPVIFHLIRRTTRERQRFGSLMFLEPTPPRLTKRSRIEHWLLLLLRAAALALLALAFARPFFRTKSPPGKQGASLNRTVILLDTSASLRRDGLWDQAKSRALQAVENADGDVAVATFDNAVTTMLTFENWQTTTADARVGLARERIESASPSWAGTDAAAALMTAAEMLAEFSTAVPGKREIVLVTDAQEGSRLEKLQGYEWPKDVRVKIETIAPKRAGNAGLQLATESRAETDIAAGVRLRVSNSTDATSESFQLGWQAAGGGFAETAQDVYVPPGQSRIVTLAWPDGGPKSGRVVLRGDAEEFDNVIHVTPQPPVTVTIIHSGKDAEPRGPLFFLQKALPASRALTASLSHLGLNALPPVEAMNSAPLWFITDPLDASVAGAAGAYATGGGTVLLMLHTPDMAATLQSVTASPSVKEEPVKPATYAMLGTIDFGHPLFAAFAEPRFSDFTKIRFWNYCKLDAAALTNAKVIAKFDSGDPALLEVPRDKGRVFILAAGWHPASSQLALSSKFPSLLASLLAGTGVGAQMPAQFFAGETLSGGLQPPLSTSPQTSSVSQLTLTPPGGSTTSLSATAPHVFTTPGLHHLKWDGGERDIAVNLDPAESRTAPLAVEEFEKLGAPISTAAKPVAAPSPAEESLAAAAEAEGRQKLWRWLLAAVFAVLFIETLLGTRTARQYSTAEGGSPV